MDETPGFPVDDAMKFWFFWKWGVFGCGFWGFSALLTFSSP
jgi:hypothetical protein